MVRLAAGQLGLIYRKKKLNGRARLRLFCTCDLWNVYPMLEFVDVWQ